MPIDPTSEPPAPRQARSIETRRRLLEAAIECLIERGFASTTTAHVCQQAGVSQGALFKHFPTKAVLWVACVERLFADLMVDFKNAFQAIAGEADRVGAAVRLLDRSFREPRLHAAFELFLVSRHDSALREALEPVVIAFRESLRDEARALFPVAARENEEFDAFFDVMLSAMQGRALSALVAPDSRADVRELVTLYRLVSREVAGGRGA
ncbi:MAG: TetR/AcrR family transcriptional regulator [Myxococcota bacterium]|nr:TetR/AcrR family transcriptional regulator [Myxococcota bacterium]